MPDGQVLATMTRQYFDHAAEFVDITPGIRTQLRQPSRNITVNFPVRMDDGRIQMFTGFRVHHSVARGPAKGGLRYTPTASLEYAQALAMLMTLKSAVMGIPFGGAKGAVICNPKTLSQHELQGITRRYTSEIVMLLGPEKDIVDTDVGTDERTMAWVMDTYSALKGYSVPAVATGKPEVIGGTAGMNRSTGRGVVFVLRDAAERMGIELAGARVAVQGFGRVGSTVAYLLDHVLGVRVVAVSDSRATLYADERLDLRDVKAYKDEYGTLEGYPNAQVLPAAAVLTVPSEILVLAASELTLTEADAPQVQARLIIEGANAPTTTEADHILRDREITVIPDIVASAGRVTVSYFEWVQSLQSFFWTEEEVTSQLRRIMLRAFDEVCQLADERRVAMRTAAYILGIERVARAYKLRGIYP